MTEATKNSSTEAAELGVPGRRFKDFGLTPDVLEALAGMGIDTPTPIQDVCIPAILAGRDVVGKAETGTGKTIGFGAPLVGRIDTQRVAVQALVLTPTRELAQQVAGVFEVLGAGRGLGVALVVGGVHASEQILKLRSGSQIVVGTPGRVLDFLRERTLSLVWCETVVLDEADRMLDMGFIDDVSAILDKTPKERQTLLFSATIPPEIQKLLKRYMQNPAQFSTSQGLSTVADIRQLYVEAEFRTKFRTLQRVLDSHAGSTVIIFCNTRRQAIDLDRMLWGHGYSAGALHGDQEQDVRFRILESFRKGDIKILVATDVASRGLDVEDVACVVNYEIPDEPESYVHRIGRTGRAQKSGEAISIVSGKELGSWHRIVKQTGFKVQRWGSERAPPQVNGERPPEAAREAPRQARSAPRNRAGGSPDSPSRPHRDHRGPPHEEFASPASFSEAPSGWAEEEDRELPTQRTHPPGGERFVAQENENQNVTPAAGDASAAKNREQQRPERGSQEDRPADGGGDRKRSRRRRRRGGGGPERGHQAQQPAQAPHQGPRGALTAAPQGSAPAYEGSDEVPTPDEMVNWLKDRPKPSAEKPQRMKLEELDDDYLKTEYFDVDHSLVERAGPAPKPAAPPGHRPAGAGGQGPDRRGERRPESRPDSRQQGGGRRPDPSRGHGRRPDPVAGPRPGAPAGPAGQGQQARGGRPEAQGQSRPADSADGQGRRRRRRRGRGRGRPGGPEGGGPGQQGG